MAKGDGDLALRLMPDTEFSLHSRVVCVLEPDAAVRDSLVEYLSLFGEQVHAFENGQDFKTTLPTLAARCILCAAELPDHRGVELFQWLRVKHPRVLFALTVSSHQHAVIREAHAAGVAHILHKPQLLSGGLAEFLDHVQTADSTDPERTDEPQSSADHTR
ncbi:MAG: response regulator [Pseudomonadales bacterium]